MNAGLLPNATHISTAPGRVNLLGEHVDYNDGIVLPAAIDRCVRIAAKALPGRQVHLFARDLNLHTDFDLDQLEAKINLEGKPLPGWAQYPAGVAWALQKAGLAVNGFEAVYTSNVPIGSGLSSSAAVEVAFAVLWQELGGWKVDRVKLAQYCQQAENQYVGLNCGLMDQFASANGVEGHALVFDTRSLDFFSIPLPPQTALVIADSGVRRSLASSAYNERRAACEQAVDLLRPSLPGIRALRDVTPEQFNRYATTLPELIAWRARHVVEEIARVDEALVCLRQGDAAGFGRLMFAGHASLRDLYEVSCPELDLLVETARNLPGCWGARLTGAGFGGCTVNLVEENQTEAFVVGLKSAYQQTTKRQAEVTICHASRGAFAEKKR